MTSFGVFRQVLGPEVRSSLKEPRIVHLDRLIPAATSDNFSAIDVSNERVEKLCLHPGAVVAGLWDDTVVAGDTDSVKDVRVGTMDHGAFAGSVRFSNKLGSVQVNQVNIANGHPEPLRERRNGKGHSRSLCEHELSTDGSWICRSLDPHLKAPVNPPIDHLAGTVECDCKNIDIASCTFCNRDSVHKVKRFTDRRDDFLRLRGKVSKNSINHAVGGEEEELPVISGRDSTENWRTKEEVSM